jgi:NADH dehydrogenase
MACRQSLSRSLHTPRRPIPQWRTLAPASTPSRFKSEVAAKAEPLRRSAIVGALYKVFTYCGFFIISGGVVVVGFFLYDASTYRDSTTAADIPVSELALNPRRGGPKNLPIADVLVGDYDSESMLEQKDKPRLVILGTGWGSIALLKNLNPADYHVTVVSPTNYFLFTPMLPSATVGTLGLRSLVEPVRRIIDRVNGHFLKASATDVDFSAKLVEVSQVDNEGVKKSFYLPYDKLVVGVGMLCPRTSVFMFQVLTI